jgi:hypothetical protein
MTKIDGSEMLVRALEAEGVREIFTLHGGHLDAIYAACGRHDFRVIDTRHEQAAHIRSGALRSKEMREHAHCFRVCCRKRENRGLLGGARVIRTAETF